MKKILLLLSMLFFAYANLCASDIDASIDIVEDDNSYIVNAQNNEPFDVFLVLNFPKLTGLKPSSDTLPAIIKLAPGTHEDVFRLTALPDARTLSYATSYNFLYGDPLNTNPDGYLYYFPYKHGTRQRIVQGWGGKFSHGGQNEYAVDFDLDEGTEIYAARAGEVVAIKKDSNRGGVSPAYNNYANYIMIKHSDGTFGNYVHLRQNGVLVKVGDRVEVGQLIGYSGSTGFASGPHLHFDIRIPTLEGVSQSIPFKFRDRDDNPIIPEAGKSYYAAFPGGEDFEEIHGEDISAEDYKDYALALSGDYKKDNLEFRSEIIDDKMLIFVSNSYDKDVSAEIFLTLQNLRIDEPLPIKIDIPSNTEIFLTLLFVKDPNQNTGFRSRAKFQLKESE